MYERILDKSLEPTIDELSAYCGENADLFVRLNKWLGKIYGTVQEVVFPYGNTYGWGVAHRIKQKLVCNIFAERDAFTVMLRLSNAQFRSIYNVVGASTQEIIDNRYICGDGGWVHCRVTCEERLEDIKTMLKAKCN